MLLDLAKAIVVEADGAVKPIIAHPSNREHGISPSERRCLHNTRRWPLEFVSRRTFEGGTRPLISSLTLGHVESKNESPEEFEKAMNKVVVPELQAYSAAGGQVLFGTDGDDIEQFDNFRASTPCQRSIIG
jgi:hypothetical protein